MTSVRTEEGTVINKPGSATASDMATEKKGNASLLMDGVAWSSNVSTTILIIFITKWLMTTFAFRFATTLSGLHFLTCAASIRSASALGFIQHVSIPFKDILIFSVIGSISIASANLSLLLNTVGFYQISKLLLAPFVCVIESIYFKKHFSVPVQMSILTVLVGVGIVTVSNVNSNFLGTVMAVIFVVSSGFQQILCGHFQSKFKLQSHQLLANTSPTQGLLLLLAGPYLDQMVTGRWVLAWQPSQTGLALLLVSCVVAIGVNLSQFLCLGRFSATSFQVLGHAKTILVLLGGWLLFQETVNMRQLSGMTLAVGGMIAYGYFMSKGGTKQQAAPAAAGSGEAAKAEKEPLLPMELSKGQMPASDASKASATV